MRHDGYLGALGAFLGGEPPQAARSRVLGRGSLRENFARSQSISTQSVSAFGVLDAVRDRMTEFPLLADPAAYDPDTISLVDPARHTYWLDAFARTIPGLAKAVRHSLGSDSDVEARLDQFATYASGCGPTRARACPCRALGLMWPSRGRGPAGGRGGGRGAHRTLCSAFTDALNRLRLEPAAFGPISVRSLLDLREQVRTAA